MLALCLVPLHMRESLEFLIIGYPLCTEEEEAEEATTSNGIHITAKAVPKIVIADPTKPLSEQNSFTIECEHMFICRTNSFSKAVMLIIMTYFVLNLAIPKKFEGTFAFLQKILLGHKDGMKMNSKSCSFVQKLNKL